jgi:hypothetical protein
VEEAERQDGVAPSLDSDGVGRPPPPGRLTMVCESFLGVSCFGRATIKVLSQ